MKAATQHISHKGKNKDTFDINGIESEEREMMNVVFKERSCLN